MSPPADLSRAVLLGRLAEARVWDVVVIGGGSTGLGCAVDAAARGYATLLLEAHDFAKGTSSRATKLIHGGVRYLAQGNLPLVREALAERAVLLANAPHLVHPQRFVVPAYHWYDRPMLGVGLGLYDLLAGARGLGRCRVLDPARTVAALPTVNPQGLCGGIAYWDARFDDARMAVALMRTLLDLGGLALNHMPVQGLMVEDGKVRGVHAVDGETGTAFKVAARVVINATGVWADAVRRWERPRAPALLRPSQGVHVVVGHEFLPGTDAMLVPRTEDGRVLFAIPWQGRVLLGTTDTPRPDLPLEPRPLEGEVDFILATAGRYLARAPTRADVTSVFVGLRPLIGAGDASPTRSLSREHVIEVSSGGLVSITGGKWTTYRHMGADAVDSARSVAGLPARDSVTADLRLHGTTAGPSDDPYGSDRAEVQALPGAGIPILDGLDLSEAEVRFAVRRELARTVEDVLARRHRALFVDAALAAAAAPRVAALLAEELERDEAWAAAQVAAFEALAAGYRLA
ncbi:glycerol-3-phosphate dehydrogenase/oxidase [Pseudothauera rhizosphaerae]|uniref:Glycerol-3-phosphate dehydrogenase/oxidase n=1 Tax=Pseudothauera rhizosphaerae TaxID=2565932 RepID=A0A4S4AQ95_9RHOO|nr:glycerol-3-phosphate dehydrogenase/oxidase [Pseudothauera rhizosphaerae]THF60614.1 glycerol-3-phosphate dehydrogenase/oxidase [Pseudothauera rhizosphaerae]